MAKLLEVKLMKISKLRLWLINWFSSTHFESRFRGLGKYLDDKAWAISRRLDPYDDRPF